MTTAHRFRLRSNAKSKASTPVATHLPIAQEKGGPLQPSL